MAYTTISLTPEDTPRAEVLTAPREGGFIVLAVGTLTFYLPGYNAVNAAAARALATALLAAADDLDAATDRSGVIAQSAVGEL